MRSSGGGFKRDLVESGFRIIEAIYKEDELSKIMASVEKLSLDQQFGVRSFLKQHPSLIPLLFNQKLLDLIHQIAPKAKVIKSIYFDKPPHANWIVNWHQDLTINVIGKEELPYFKNWRVLSDRTVVQPPVSFLQQITTIRIHLDDCHRENGALQVVPGSHQHGVISVKDDLEHWTPERQFCEVGRGGVLIMKPLLLHASRRTENLEKRRVIHIEVTDQELPVGLMWWEAL